MKMGKKMWIFLVMSAMLASLVTGCAGRDSGASAEGGSTGEKVKLTVLMNGVAQMSGVQDDPVTKAVEEKLGITMDIISTSGMDLTAELNALIASDDLPDIVVGITPEQRQLLVDSEQIIPLDGLVEQYGGEINNKKAGQQALEFSKKYYSDESGQLYFIGLRAGEDYDSSFPTVAPYIRWDIYNQIGAPKIENMDQMLDVLKQMQDAYPETEDGKKVYAVSGCLADPGWNTFSLSSAEAFIGFRKLDNYGLVGTNIYDVTGYINAMENADSPTWQLFQYWNKAYQMGILDPECVTMKYDQWVEKIQAGQVLYAPFSWFATVPVMNDPNKTFLPVTFENFENDSFTCSYAYTPGADPYAISKKCKYPERAMELLNYAWSYEGSYLFQNGVQGENWDIIDGEPQYLDAYVQGLNDGTAEAVLFGSFFGPFMNEDTNQPIALSKTASYFEKYKCTGVVKEYCDQYGITAPVQNYTKAGYHIWDEAWQKGLQAYTGDLKEIDSRIQDYVLTNIPKMVLAETDEEFETMRLKFMEDINAMGAQELYESRIEDYQNTVKEVLEMQNK
ncbi:extracellular solute-binding protein [Lachnotalea sp. AF33-28]|uniref:extracellular solute-binding protein n=1 Tax=Lachnotalea sp. AF33-28 TaxID=2292046 RepID=UPI000E49840A|nr:extracellular solute-binding protein [Lachnotalea sp. AF33-28]RHP29201.1 extracellular solute-binding protein [Lachnotalea sp. AF33-28]